MIIQGDCLTELKKLDGESINCCVTSPPYWALRDYGTAVWEGGSENCEHRVGRATRGGLSDLQKGNHGGFGDEAIRTGQCCPHCGAKRIDKQLGLEPTFQEYINKLCDIFDEVKRVLRKDGTCWVNLGDSYNSHGETGRKDKHKYGGISKVEHLHAGGVKNYPAKCLCQIPQRFSIEMCNRGWILRNILIWHKPNCMPSSVKDRFTVDFEYIFFFVKNKKYWFETQREPHLTKPVENTMSRAERKANTDNNRESAFMGNAPQGFDGKPMGYSKQGRNKRAVWKITTKPFKGAHFAVFPEELIETPIKAGCPKGGTVLDPFCGSGTTGLVAKKQGKEFIGLELNPEYIEMAEKRIANTQGSLF